jgi:predicted enzyme related to lactoylglutathione lyase
MKIKNPVVWFEIYVDDIERSKIFYEKVLNIKLSELPMPELPDGDNDMKMLAFPMEMEGEGAAGALVKTKEIKAGGNSTIIYFGSEDCSVEESRIEDAGGKVIQSKQSIGEFGFMVMANDTEGNVIGIHSQT